MWLLAALVYKEAASTGCNAVWRTSQDGCTEKVLCEGMCGCVGESGFVRLSPIPMRAAADAVAAFAAYPYACALLPEFDLASPPPHSAE